MRAKKKKAQKKAKRATIKKPTIEVPDFSNLPPAMMKAAKKAFETAVASEILEMAYDQMAEYVKWVNKSKDPEAKKIREDLRAQITKGLKAEMANMIEDLVRDVNLNMY